MGQDVQIIPRVVSDGNKSQRRSSRLQPAYALAIGMSTQKEGASFEPVRPEKFSVEDG